MGDFETADPEALPTGKETSLSAGDYQWPVQDNIWPSCINEETSLSAGDRESDLVCAACGLCVAGVAEGFSAWEDGVERFLAMATGWDMEANRGPTAKEGSARRRSAADAQRGDHRRAVGADDATRRTGKHLRRGQEGQGTQTALGRGYAGLGLGGGGPCGRHPGSRRGLGRAPTTPRHLPSVEKGGSGRRIPSGYCARQLQGICHRLRKIVADAAYKRCGLVQRIWRAFGWVLQTVLRLVRGGELVVLPKRWIVERTFAWLSMQRRLAKDYERNPRTSEPMIQAARIALMLRRLAKLEK